MRVRHQSLTGNARFVSNEVAIRFCASRQAPSGNDLQELACASGFSDVDVRVSRIHVRLPRLDEFSLHHLATTPIAPNIAAADPEVLRQVGASVRQQLQQYAEGDGVVYPEETYVLTVRVP